LENRDALHASKKCDLEEAWVSGAEYAERNWEDWAVISSLMMVCAVLASLALGVLVAYGICQVMFRVFRVHVESAARERVQSAATRVALEG
jgi:hypothetical protein